MSIHRSLCLLGVALLSFSPLRAEYSAFFDVGAETHTEITGLAAEGRVAFGVVYVPRPPFADLATPAVWTFANDTWISAGLPGAAMPDTPAAPVAASADGTVIAGVIGHFTDEIPTVWTEGPSGWQKTTLPLPAEHGASPEFISADGSVIFGYATPQADLGTPENSSHAWAWRRVDGIWSGGLLPEGERGHARNALSRDGSSAGGSRVIPAPTEADPDASFVAATVWRHDGTAWQVHTLHAPDGSPVNGVVWDLSADGRTAVGEIRTPDGWRATAWDYTGGEPAWQARILPGLNRLSLRDSKSVAISADGKRVVGESHNPRKSTGPINATVWLRTDAGWTTLPMGPTSSSSFSRGVDVSGDGRLAIRNQPAGATLFLLPAGKNLSIASLTSSLEIRPDAAAKWDFSAYHANITHLAQDPVTGAYTLAGYGTPKGETRPVPWIISGYTPFLDHSTSRVGDTVSIVLPDLGPGAYKVSGLPSGLTYDDTTRTVSGRLSKVGLFTATYTNVVNKRKRTAFMLVEPLSTQLTGTFQTLLNTDDEDGVPVARVTLAVNIKGGFTGTLECDDNASYALKGVFALDPEQEGHLAAFTKFTSVEPGIVVTRKKNSDTPAFRLLLRIRPDGSLEATLVKPGIGTYAVSSDDGVRQSHYAGTKPEDSAPWHGRYTSTLGVPVALIPGDLRPLPVGGGYATITVGRDGKLSLSGRAADGQSFTGSVRPGSDGTYRLLLRPYRLRESLIVGWLRFDLRSDGLYHVAPEAGGDLYWMRAANPATKVYPAGFGPAGLALRVEPWVKPVTPATFGVEENTPLSLRLASTDFTNQEGANRYNLPQSAHFLGRLRLARETTPERAGALGFSVNPNTGRVTGSFTITEPGTKTSRKLAFVGVLLPTLPDAPAPILQGYFLQPALKGATPTDTLSGLITLSPPDAE